MTGFTSAAAARPARLVNRCAAGLAALAGAHCLSVAGTLLPMADLGLTPRTCPRSIDTTAGGLTRRWARISTPDGFTQPVFPTAYGPRCPWAVSSVTLPAMRTTAGCRRYLDPLPGPDSRRRRSGGSGCQTVDCPVPGSGHPFGRCDRSGLAVRAGGLSCRRSDR